MNFKKIILVSLILLAVLTMGAVSAADNITSDKLEAAAADNADVVSVSGNEKVICKINSSDETYDNFDCRVSGHAYGGGLESVFDVRNDVGDGTVDLNVGCTVGSDDLIASSEEDILTDSVTEDNFNPWVSSHEPVDADWNPWIVNVHGDDIITDGVVSLTISKGGSIIFTDEKSFGVDNDEHNDIIWSLDYLRDNNVLDEAGTYDITLKYVKDDTVFDFGNYNFILTQFDYNICEGDMYIRYPFDVIRIWDEGVEVKVYVGSTEVYNGGDNPLRWNLYDLGISEVGEYAITINANKDAFEEEFIFNLKIDDDVTFTRLISNNMGIQSWELDNPVLYLFSSDDMIGNTVRFVMNDKEEELEITDAVMNWTLEDLGIGENGGFDIRIIYDDEEVASTYFNVNGFSDPINVEIWDEDTRGKLYNDFTGDVVSVDVPEDKCYGSITVIVNGERQYLWQTDLDNRYYSWSLNDLEITEDGVYEIVVKHVVYDEDEIESEEILREAVLNVSTFNNDDFRAVLDKDSEVLKVYCYEEGVIYILVERDNDGNPEIVTDLNITIENTGNWREFSLTDLRFAHDGCYYSFDVSIRDSEDEELYHFNGGHSVDSVRSDVAEGEVYLDYESDVIRVYVPEGNAGELNISVNGDVKYTLNVYSDREYTWNFKTLNITKTGEYTLKVMFNDDVIAESEINVIEFANDTFRLKAYYHEGTGFVIFCPENAEGTIIVNVYNREQDDELVETHEIPIDDIYKGKWTDLIFESNYDIDGEAFIEVEINGNVIDREDVSYTEGSPGFEVNHVKTDVSFGDDEVLRVIIPYDRIIDDAAVNITSGEYSFYKKLSDFNQYEWDNGDYRFSLTKDDLDYFTELSDKDVIRFVFVHEDGKLTRWMSIEKSEDDFSLYDLTSSTGEFGDIYSYGLEIIIEANTAAEDEDEEITSDYFAVVSIPDSFNVTEGKINIVSGNKTLFSKGLSEINHDYIYSVAGNRYYITFDNLNLENLIDKDIVNITLTSNGEVIEYLTLVHLLDDEGNSIFYGYSDNVEFSVHYHSLANPESGMSGSDGSFIQIMIPDALEVDGGNIIIAYDDGTVLFNWSLDSFDNSDSRFIKQYSDFNLGFEYTIMANETIYSAFPENVNLTFSFVYDDKIISRKGIVRDGELNRIVVSDDMTNMFEIIIPDNVLINGDDFAVTIKNINANRQSIYFDLGGGYFSVYVNGKKIEDLGRLNRYDGETELELFRLCSNGDGVNQLYINLGDINITDNGIYDIKVTHTDEDGQESEIFARNITLTSNVKVDNVTSDVFTGFGMDPVLFYLDTYYGDINETSGTVTVLNSTGDIIFTSDIRSLSKDDAGRYYIKYSDFENKNFGDKITVMYGDGNERSGNTTVNVTWKDVDSEVFNPVVNIDVKDYYGDFINMDIPDLLNDGQIIVTVKFKGNHITNIPNMNVISEFGSQAVYKFNVADIKANYDTFKLSLSDLGFYEDDGKYDITVQFTADGTDKLDVTDNTLNVEFLDDILITIDENSRYAYELPFAGVRVFEPVNAYADLYIDGILYMHKTFDNGEIKFTSSKAWASGVHTAELRVIHSEFGSLLNSSSVEFETLIKTSDVEVNVDDNVKENEHVIIRINVPEAGNVTIKSDVGTEKVYSLSEGLNSIDLGLLAYGNRSIWVDYNVTLDDGNVSFFTGPVSVFVGDDGHWLNIPEPLILNDDDTIKMNFGEGASGYILVYIDNKLVANRTLVNGAAEYTLTDAIFDEDYSGDLLGAPVSETKYGKHTYKIFYSGDATHDSLTKEGEFTVAYIFKDNLADEYPLRESYDITVTLPDDAKGTVRFTVNNKPFTAEVKDGSAKFRIDNLTFGVHEVFIEYIGDDYPYAGYSSVLNISYYGVVGEYSSDAKYVSLMLPENATGNLTVYNDNMRSIVRTIQVTEGIAKIDLSDLSVGIYDVQAYYDGDDYDVRSFATSFRVMPKVIIQQGVIMGDNGNIFLDLDNATGHIVIAMDGLSPVVQEINNGVVNYSFTTEGYSKGNHTVTFLYFGKSFDGNIFYEEDGKTQIKYDMLVLPQETTGNTKSDGEMYSVTILDAEGHIAYDAKGTVEFFVNGVKVAVSDIINGIASLDISKYKNGKYLITWVYSGDNKYSSSSGQSSMDINRKIIAKDLSMQYSSNTMYSVSVSKGNGPAGGVYVTFLINGKVLKTVKTNTKGVASVVIKNTPGTYKITSKALGLSTTKTLKVTHILSLKKVKVKKSAKKLVIKVKLKKVNGKYLKSKKITLKFNGKKFTAKTNKKGVAKFTIKSKVLKKLKVGKKVKYQATYLKDTVKKTVKVKK